MREKFESKVPLRATFADSVGERIGVKVDTFHTYQVSRLRGKAGKLGKKIALRTNHFPMEIDIPGGVIYHYNVEFKFSEKTEKEVKNRKLLLKAIPLLKEKYSKILLNSHAVVFDGIKI